VIDGRARVFVTTRGRHAGVSASTVRRRAEKMIGALELGPVELSVALVDDATIRGLNRSYRRKDKATDVLAFPLQEVDKRRLRGLAGALGDVILSVDTARKQARRHRRPLLDELTMLLAHGLLHLVGFDHRNDREEREMTGRTRALETAGKTRAAPSRKK
jgi:probable rRNA maturation factor